MSSPIEAAAWSKDSRWSWTASGKVTKDDFETDSILIHGEEECDHFDIESFEDIKLEESNSIWILESTRYKDLKYKIKGNDLYLEYDSTDDLKLYERYIVSIVLKSE